MFSQIDTIRHHNIASKAVAMPICESKQASWLPEQNIDFGRGYNMQRVLGRTCI